MPVKQRKIALMGFRSVGKSSLTIQFVENKFVDSYDPTIENTFVKTTKIKGQEYSLRLVDTAGQDEYSIFPHAYAIDIHGYCLVYSINSLKSFEVVKVIYEKLLDMTGKVHVPIVLVGNKVDLHMERCVSSEEGRRLAEYMKADFVEVRYDRPVSDLLMTCLSFSAKDNAAVTGFFHKLIISVERGAHESGDNTTDKQNKCVIA